MALTRKDGANALVDSPVNEAELETLQRETFDYFIHEANPANGLIVDKTKEPLNKVEFVGPMVLHVDFADMRFQNSD